jgi:hypothetical protein
VAMIHWSHFQNSSPKSIFQWAKATNSITGALIGVVCIYDGRLGDWKCPSTDGWWLADWLQLSNWIIDSI